MQIQYRWPPRKSEIKYIVVHDTGNASIGADAMAHFNYFNSGDRGASADFFVDDTISLQVNDYTKYYTWHCGDGKGKRGVLNSNSVGLEICVNSDGNYNLAFQNAVVVVKKLMKELYIPPENVIRHYDVSQKKCPASMSADNWALWLEFKKMISEKGDLSVTQYEELKAENENLRREIEDIKLHQDKVYRYGSSLPAWAAPTIQKLVDKGYYKGANEGDLNLPESLMRMLVINDRAGLYK